MERRNGQSAGVKINFQTIGKKYCVVTQCSGAPAADFYNPKLTGGIIVPQDRESSANIDK
ncbi:hypothetical protein [Desulfoscipio geothermicus]|nr:hypothetical protein [Desulfoscipio geothermicus]